MLAVQIRKRIVDAPTRRLRCVALPPELFPDGPSDLKLWPSFGIPSADPPHKLSGRSFDGCEEAIPPEVPMTDDGAEGLPRREPGERLTIGSDEPHHLWVRR